MADLVSRSALDSSIKRIIAVDAVNHGDSAFYNTGKLSSRGKLHMYCSVAHFSIRGLTRHRAMKKQPSGRIFPAISSQH